MSSIGPYQSVDEYDKLLAVVDSLRRTVPSFDAVEAEWWDEYNEGLPYSRLGALVSYLEQRIENGHLEELPGFMAEVEQILTTATTEDWADDLISCEVIEGLHHLTQVIPYLGPKTRVAWDTP